VRRHRGSHTTDTYNQQGTDAYNRDVAGSRKDTPNTRFNAAEWAYPEVWLPVHEVRRYRLGAGSKKAPDAFAGIVGAPCLLWWVDLLVC